MNNSEPISDNQAADTKTVKSTARGRWQLSCVLLVVLVLWGYVFPAISETELQMEKRRQMEERGIDPMALFYTDHLSTEKRLSKP